MRKQSLRGRFPSWQTNCRLKWNNNLFPCLYCHFKVWKYCNISVGCCGIGEMCALPVFSMVRLSFLPPVQIESSRSSKSLKLFGAWKMIYHFRVKNSGKSVKGLPPFGLLQLFSFEIDKLEFYFLLFSFLYHNR